MSIVLDFRPLQGGDSGRGIGSTVRGLAGCFPELKVLLWSRKPRPTEAMGRDVVLVHGPARRSRMSWSVDAGSSRISHSRSRHSVWHLLSADVAYDGGGPCIVTVNDTVPWRFPDLYPMGPTGKAWMRFTARASRQASHVVVPSHTSARDVVRFFGVAEDKVRVVPWAADPDLVIPSAEDRDRLKGVYSLPGRYFVMAGGFAHQDPRKRYVDAVNALRRVDDDVHLYVTGGAGPAAAELARTVEQSGLSSRVHLTGFLDASVMASLYAGASAFVFPSLWEGFGLPVLNAFALGVPAVVSDGGSLPEVAGGAALVYPAGDADALGQQLERLLGDPALASGLIEKGRKRNLAFTWKATGALYGAVYTEAGSPS
ncbi:MAG: glycosyltransferase family 1 protein [Acidimicrobiales bacterium]